MTDRVRSVERGIDVLMTLATGPKTLTEVCQTTGLSKATAHRLLANLGHRDLVLKQPGENLYLLGPGFLRLMQGAQQGLGSLGILAKPALAEAVAATGETVTLHVRLGLERICVEEVQSPAPIRYAAAAGHTAPLHVGAAGKALLAFLSDEELERTLDALRLEAGPEEPGVEELRTELQLVRSRGYAVSSGERFAGAAAVSVPVRSGGDLLASLSILGPADRFPAERERELVRVARRAADQMEKTLETAAAEQRGSKEVTR
jgi:DNA-binding IclR family transcriptional regulator